MVAGSISVVELIIIVMIGLGGLFCVFWLFKSFFGRNPEDH